MNRVLAALLVVLLLGVVGYYQFGDTPLDARSAIDDGIRSAKKTSNLSKEDEAMLRVQLAIVDFTGKHGQPPMSLSQLVPTYFDQIPKNPQTKKPFKYARNGASYQIGPQLTRVASVSKGSEVGSSGKLNKEQTARAQLLSELDEDVFINPNAMVLDDFVYDPTGKRDPFRPFDMSPKAVREGPLTPLERYGIGQLRLTAVLSSPDGGKTAIVEDAAGKGYTVKNGTKIGDQGGVVVNIEDDRLKILETKVDFTGTEVQNVVEMKINQG